VFFSWLNLLQIVRLEFSHYDLKSSNTISAKDFALSMVASADMNHIDKLLDRVDDLDDNLDLKDLRITFEVGLSLINHQCSWVHHLFHFKLESIISGVQGIC
jgi:hypothetical protein